MPKIILKLINYIIFNIGNWEIILNVLSTYTY